MDFSAGASHLSPHNHQYSQQQGSGSPGYSQYSPAIDPNLGGTPANSRQFHHTRAGSSPSFNASPRFTGSSPGQPAASFVPTDRSLPPRDGLSAENVDEVYAAFVLYCNPYFPPNFDTTELKKVFKKPPMSDNKTFEPFNLYELIVKLEKGEIKTWIQLALDLGVEPPDTEKGQSTQKVQQYAVRLKRWLRAMHIDAFFEFLQGKPHSYYTNIPPPNDPFPPGGRDGVPLEEDLAVRALDSSFKPKRGRKKVDDLDDDGDHATPLRKRPQLDTSFAFNNGSHPQSAYPHSAMPMSAHPDDFVANDPWTAATMPTPSNVQRGLTPQSALTAPGSQHVRWRLNNQDNPSTPHPLSAVSPMTERPLDSAFDEAMSAVTPSTSRSRPRRRHGPAVSSAWPSGGSGSSGKIRGRPPSNRSVRDGPYVTFPANPNTREGPTIDLARTTPDSTATAQLLEVVQSQGQNQGYRLPPTPASSTQGSAQAPPNGRAGHRLSLQVPQHVGGPVHLVTPTVLVNGESNSPDKQQVSAGAAPRRVAREDLKRLVAADLLRADISNRKRLRGHEAKALADALLKRLSVQNDAASRSFCGSADEEMLHYTYASWLGYSTHLGLGPAPAPGSVKRIMVQKYRVSDDGYESPIDEDDGVEASDNTPAPGEGTKIKEVFDVSWSLLLGGCGGEFAVKGLTLEANEDADGDKEGGEGESEGEGEGGGGAGKEKSLEEKVRELEAQLEGKDREVQLWRQRVLEAVL